MSCLFWFYFIVNHDPVKMNEREAIPWQYYGAKKKNKKNQGAELQNNQTEEI